MELTGVPPRKAGKQFMAKKGKQLFLETLASGSLRAKVKYVDIDGKTRCKSITGATAL